jgi:light-regulated signal transduction histidine kinase (bacteriophytochrome)
MVLVEEEYNEYFEVFQRLHGKENMLEQELVCNCKKIRRKSQITVKSKLNKGTTFE